MDSARSPIAKRPSYPSSAIAVLAALCGAGLATDGPTQLGVVAVGGIGAFGLLGSSAVRHRGRKPAGIALLLAASLVVGVSVGLGAVYPGGPVERAALLAASLGPCAVVVGLSPLRSNWAGSLAGLGVALVLGAVVLRAWLTGMGRLHALVAVTATIVAWDAAKQAIALGNDVGRGARTYPVSTTHTAGSLTVGLLAIPVATGISGVLPTTVPVASLALFLGAALVLLLTLYLGYLE